MIPSQPAEMETYITLIELHHYTLVTMLILCAIPSILLSSALMMGMRRYAHLSLGVVVTVSLVLPIGPHLILRRNIHPIYLDAIKDMNWVYLLFTSLTILSVGLMLLLRKSKP